MTTAEKCRVAQAIHSSPETWEAQFARALQEAADVIWHGYAHHYNPIAPCSECEVGKDWLRKHGFEEKR